MYDFGGKSRGKTSLGRFIRRLDDSFKIDLRAMEWYVLNFLKTVTNDYSTELGNEPSDSIEFPECLKLLSY
jgi:hypothetical protein